MHMCIWTALGTGKCSQWRQSSIVQMFQHIVGGERQQEDQLHQGQDSCMDLPNNDGHALEKEREFGRKVFHDGPSTM